ncbi:unannotated protein [freshwater metagenome]|uniref:Unannotated protein n=1 Tax=freshwater metagenome TaxID=449393 RepID=A0A6J7BJ56_9ZZZZ
MSICERFTTGFGETGSTSVNVIVVPTTPTENDLPVNAVFNVAPSALRAADESIGAPTTT